MNKNNKIILFLIFISLMILVFPNNALAVSKKDMPACFYSATTEYSSNTKTFLTNTKESKISIYFGEKNKGECSLKKIDKTADTIHDCYIEDSAVSNIVYNNNGDLVSTQFVAYENGKYYCPDKLYFYPSESNGVDEAALWTGTYPFYLSVLKTSPYGELKLESTQNGAKSYETSFEKGNNSLSRCKLGIDDYASVQSGNIDNNASNNNYLTAAKVVENTKNELAKYCDSEKIVKYEKELSKKIDELNKKINSSKELSESEKKELLDKTSNIQKEIDEIVTDKSEMNVPFEEGEYTCNDLIDGDLKVVIKLILKWIRIGVPILLIVLVSVDFGQAVISNDNDAIKKATSKAIKRAIAALAVFFIPLIVDVMIDWIKLDENGKVYFDRENVNCSSLYEED